MPLVPLLLGWLALLASSSLAYAQLVVDNWTTENGLPQNSVNDILQTRDRYIWFATHGGLVRFDGVRFVVFDRGTEGIESQRIMALHEDRAGTLWAASDNGMLIRYRDGRFKTFGTADGLPHLGGVRIEEDDGGLWITWTDKLTRYDGERFQTYTPAEISPPVTSPPNSRYLDTWWSQTEDGLRALVRGRVQSHQLRDLPADVLITRVSHERNGNIWISTNGAGVIRLSDQGQKRYTRREGFPTDSPSGWIRQGGNGEIWFADPSGLYRIRNGRHERFENPALNVGDFRSLLVDDEGSTWIGTPAKGVFRIHDAPISVVAERDGVSLRQAYAVLQDRDGAIWVSTNGLHRYANGRVRSYSDATGLSPERVGCLYRDRAERIWVCTFAGVMYLDGDRLRRYLDESGFLSNAVVGLIQDRHDAYWFATESGVVTSSGTHVRRYTTADGLSHNRVTALFEDRNGVIWIGTAQGLTRYDGRAFVTFTEREGFIGSAVRTFYEDGDGMLWVGTYDGGLYRIANQRLTRFTRADGLYDDGIFQILEDDAGYFWMGSNRGIQRISRQELNEFAEGRRQSVSAVTLGARDGLTSVEVNGGRPPAGLKTGDGKLWFPTMGGLAIVDPRLFRTGPRPPSSLIEEFHLDGQSVDFEAGVVVPAGARTFDVRYTAPSFIRPSQVLFRYRLLGLHDEWVEAGNRREASFYGVPPGRYTFELVAADRDGVWSEHGAALRIAVLPPFWQTWWFGSLLLSAVVAAVVTAHKARTRRLRRLNALHERFSRQLIDSQEGERRRISNELHDSFGQELRIIRKLAHVGQAHVDSDQPAVDVLREIETVADRLQQEMTDIAYGLRPHQLDNIGLSKTIESMIRRVERATNVTFTTEIPIIDDLIPHDAHIHVFRIVQEGVSNVIAHAQASAARVTVGRDGSHVRIEIEDNGKGFSSERHVEGATSGFGLMGIRERARLLGGDMDVQSGGGGTLLTITLPAGRTSHE